MIQRRVSPTGLSRYFGCLVLAGLLLGAGPSPAQARKASSPLKLAQDSCSPWITVNGGSRGRNKNPGLKDSRYTTGAPNGRKSSSPHQWRRILYINGLAHCGEKMLADLTLVLRSAPDGARLEPRVTSGPRTWHYALIYPVQVGERGGLDFILDLKLGSDTVDTHRVNLQILSKWRGRLMPGAHGSIYLPNGAESEEQAWVGVTLEYVLSAWMMYNRKRGPSHGKVYLSTSLLRTDQRDELTLIYGLGTQLSFERNPSRTAFIPFFGFEMGGIYGPHGDGDLHSFQVTPQTGITLLATESVFLTVSGGYVIPLGANLEAQRGWRANAGLHLTLW